MVRMTRLSASPTYTTVVLPCPHVALAGSAKAAGKGEQLVALKLVARSRTCTAREEWRGEIRRDEQWVGQQRLNI